MLLIGIALVLISSIEFHNDKQDPTPITLVEFNKKTANKDKKVLVYFNASWCTVCAKMKPLIEEIEKENNSRLEVLRINTDIDKEVANEFEIDALPVLILYHNGVREWIYVGIIDKNLLKEKINTY